VCVKAERPMAHEERTRRQSDANLYDRAVLTSSCLVRNPSRFNPSSPIPKINTKINTEDAEEELSLKRGEACGRWMQRTGRGGDASDRSIRVLSRVFLGKYSF